MRKAYKVVVTVPEEEADKLRKVIGAAGGGKLGNYADCSFSIKGTGRFRPLADANPTIGRVGHYEEVSEERVEVTCEAANLEAVLKAIAKAHPYEEPAIDIYPIEIA